MAKKLKYILKLSNVDNFRELQYISVDLKEMWVGRPSCSSIDCYDNVLGFLFQSETGSKYIPFQNDLKGFNFDPHLEIRWKRN